MGCYRWDIRCAQQNCTMQKWGATDWRIPRCRGYTRRIGGGRTFVLRRLSPSVPFRSFPNTQSQARARWRRLSLSNGARCVLWAQHETQTSASASSASRAPHAFFICAITATTSCPCTTLVRRCCLPRSNLAQSRSCPDDELLFARPASFVTAACCRSEIALHVARPTG